MKVRYFKQADTSYAILDGDSYHMSIKLKEGMTAGASLRAYAEDCREKAARLIEKAKRAELANELI